MDFMNLNQAAHGDREFGFICTRMGKKRKVIVGYWQDPSVQHEGLTLNPCTSVNALSTSNARKAEIPRGANEVPFQASRAKGRCANVAGGPRAG